MFIEALGKFHKLIALAFLEIQGRGDRCRSLPQKTEANIHLKLSYYKHMQKHIEVI